MRERCDEEKNANDFMLIFSLINKDTYYFFDIQGGRFFL
jgi:hypothetical protein